MFPHIMNPYFLFLSDVIVVVVAVVVGFPINIASAGEMFVLSAEQCATLLAKPLSLPPQIRTC